MAMGDGRCGICGQVHNSAGNCGCRPTKWQGLWMFEFELKEGEIIHICGIPYKHVGSGRVCGGTNPDIARENFDLTISEASPDVGHFSND